MRIAIDARLNAYRRGGIPQYTRYLMNALAEIAPDERFISLQHREHLRPLTVASNVTRRTIWTPPHYRFEQWTLPLELLPVRPDLLHAPDFIVPLHRTFAAVATIHDLAFMRYPDILDADARAYYAQVGRSVASADGVIAVSEATRQDIIEYLDLPPERVEVIYEAAAPLFRRMDLRPGEVRVLNNQPVEVDSFLLFVSTLEPRKNLPTLLEALRVCLDRNPERIYSLVIAGARGWKDETIFQTVRDLKLGEYVHFAGGVGQYDLRWLYNACRMYVNPSLYEGFGLPLLEAMACGAPCIAADTSSLPEIGGDAAEYVAPLSVEQWADTIARLWDDDERRAELARLGQARALRFSWQRAARETLRMYQRAIEHRAHGKKPSIEKPVSDTLAPPTLDANLTADGARLCLRCGATLVAGEPYPIGVRLPGDDEGPHVVAAWACPDCGRVEFVFAAESPDSAPVVEAPTIVPTAVANGVHSAGTSLPASEPPAIEDDTPEEGVALAVEDAAPPAAPFVPLEAQATTLDADTPAAAEVEPVADAADVSVAVIDDEAAIVAPEAPAPDSNGQVAPTPSDAADALAAPESAIPDSATDAAPTPSEVPAPQAADMPPPKPRKSRKPRKPKPTPQ